MIIPDNVIAGRLKDNPGRISASLTAAMSILRGLPLIISARPRTPLRALCVSAFDTLIVNRNSKRLSHCQSTTLAALLDFGACANRRFDAKDFNLKEYETTRQLLEAAGLASTVNEYLTRLRELEQQRPMPGGDVRHHRKVRSYREAVVRLSLGVVATTAFCKPTVDEGLQATHSDDDLEILFRIVMQCQIIDDVLDYLKDVAAGLPSFLTGHASLPAALALTRAASADYSDSGDLSPSGDVFPLQVALLAASTCARLVIAMGRPILLLSPGSAALARPRPSTKPLLCSSTSSSIGSRRPSEVRNVKRDLHPEGIR